VPRNQLAFQRIIAVVFLGLVVAVAVARFVAAAARISLGP
jgi:hypothetical protein